MPKSHLSVVPSVDEDRPQRIDVNGPDDYLAAVARMVFQSGMQRKTITDRWEGIVEAFDGFALKTVAAYNEADIDRLCEDRRIIRNRRKVEAIVRNANRIQKIESEQGFANWLAGHPDQASRNDAICGEFAFIGPAGVNEFCWIIGAPISDDGDLDL